MRRNSVRDSALFSAKSRSAAAAASGPPIRRNISTLRRSSARPRRIGQDDAAGVAGEQSGVSEDHAAAEAAAERDWPDQAERVAQFFEILGPGPLVPELGGAVIAATMSALIVIEDLQMVSQRC